MKSIKFVFLFIALILSSNAFSQSPLRFSDGTFKIIQFTDLHWINGDNYKNYNDSTIFLMEKLIRSEQPDLVIITGDIVVSNGALKGWKHVIEPMVSTKTPFAVTFGNHDTETDMSKAQILEFLKTIPYNVTANADDHIDGKGNCALRIQSSKDDKKDDWIIYLFDSHSYPADKTMGTYDWIKDSQIQWYRNQSKTFTTNNGRIVPSLAFFHIPTVEFESARQLSYTLGNKFEQVCSPNLNSGLFSAFLDNKDVAGIFVGHDHNNDYIVAPEGKICLAYGRKTGYAPAYKELLGRGARVITLHENERKFDTYILTLSGKSFPYTFEQKLTADNYPLPQGTFIQDHLVEDWDDAMWQKELKALKEVGMQYLVFGPTLHTGKDNKTKSLYPSSLTTNKRKTKKDLVEACLRNAQKVGFKVFLGLNFNERWWSPDYDEAWLLKEMELGNQTASELIKKYKDRYGDTMYGWYWVWEVANIDQLSSKENQDMLVNALNINLDYLHKVTPDMPFMLCPFMNYRIGNAKDYAQIWKNVIDKAHFQSGDIFAPQDCVGAGGLELEMIPEWFGQLSQVVSTKPGLLFWSDAETFDHKDWTPAPLNRFVDQMKLASPYVSKIITFAYSHYYSPNKVDAQYHDSFLHYYKTGQLPTNMSPIFSKETLQDKIKGGWAAKTIGCTYGGPVEFQYNGTMIQDYVPINWDKDRVKWYFDNFPGLYDDIYVNLTFVEVFERLGLKAPVDSFANAFAHAPYPLWHANQAARYNILHGLKAPASGHWLNNPHADDIDSQIQTDFAGLMSPGMPNTASHITDKIGHIMNYGDGWYGGVFVAALYSLAFISDDIEFVVREALKTIPKESTFYQCLNDVIGWHKEYPDDWKRTWFECEKKWSSEVGCPDGVFAPFDIDAKINSAYVAIGLLYGNKDFFKTMDISARCGQDSDCNAATAAGVLGTMIGYNQIPEYWKESLHEIEDRDFEYTDISLNDIYKLSYEHALLVVEQEGGKIDQDQVHIKYQEPTAVAFEKSFEGHFPIGKQPIKQAITQQSEVVFEGIGIVLKGYVQCPDTKYVAQLEVLIDNKPIETAQLPVASSNAKRVDLFWKYQLPMGKHVITFNWLNPRTDAQIMATEALIYSNQPPK